VPIIGVVDAVADETVGRPHVDQSVATAIPGSSPATVNTSGHSIAVDPSQNIAYVMSAHVSGGPDGLCPFSCMGFFQPVGTDDPPAVVGKKK
jgi:hypothetical protein